MASQIVHFARLSDRDRKAATPLPKLVAGDRLERHRKLNVRQATAGAPGRLSDYICAIPHAHGGGAQFAMVAGGNVVAGDVEEVGDRIVDGHEALQMSS